MSTKSGALFNSIVETAFAVLSAGLWDRSDASYLTLGHRKRARWESQLPSRYAGNIDREGQK